MILNIIYIVHKATIYYIQIIKEKNHLLHSAKTLKFDNNWKYTINMA